MRADLTSRRDGLSRTSTGLTLAHKALIRLLAEAAVCDYLAEIEGTEEPAKDRDGVAS